MDEVEYRAWSNEHDRYCDFITLDRDGQWLGGLEIWVEDRKSFLTTEDIIIEQATGIEDKDGKMIFDGDIVEHDVYHVGIKAYRSKSEVFISDLGVRIREDKNDEECSLLRHCTNIEFVGNIHENPELLKKEK